MANITTRTGKGSALTHSELDNNFSNLNTDKAELSGADFTGNVSVDGNVAVTGTVDGRDVSADGTKLDGIEAGANVTDTANVVASLTAGTNITIASNGTITATNTDTQLTNEQVQDIVGAMLSGNTETGITVSYQDTDGTIDFVVNSQTDENFTTALKNKLDAIEGGATADQTAAEIRALVESASNSNVFTDADHSKLNAIEASATADQTDAEIRAAVEAATDSNVFTDADHTKLDGIEASADVTDTTNVVASLTAGTNITIAANGTISATSSDTVLTSEQVQDIVGAMMSGNTETGISVTYQDADGTIDFVVATQSDENFTATLKNKLDAIEASADVTDTTNVVAALTAGTNVTIDANGTISSTDTNTQLSAEQVQDIVGAMFSGNTETGIAVTYQDADGTVDFVVTTQSDENFTTSLKNKLDGIEVSADVTDTANVTAAGAVMDSELTNITAVKTLNQGVATTDSPSFAGLTVDTNTLKVDSTNNRVGILNASPDVTLDVGSATDAVHIPVGTTAQRPSSPAAGYLRYNSTTGEFEGYTTAWGGIGSSGGAQSDVFVDTMTGNGSTTTMTLTNGAVTERNTQVYIDGVYQNKSTYSLSGTTITFSEAPPNLSEVEVITIEPTTINEPADGSVTSAKLSGDLTTPGNLSLTGNASFGDNGKAVFGTSSDLQVYHSGTESWIKDAGTGSLYIDTDGTSVLLTSGNSAKNMVSAVKDGAVTLYNNNTARLATSSTGIDVTGTVTADGATIDNGHIKLSAGYSLQWDDSHERIEQSNGNLEFFTNNSQQMTISGGNVGIGITLPNRQLSVNDFSGNGTVSINASTTGASTLYFADGNTGTNIYTGFIQYNHSDNAMQFATNGGNERMRISAAGDLTLNGSVTGGRYFDIYNTGSTSSDFAITRFITQQVGSSSTTSADIYKRKNGEFGFVNNDTDSAAYINFKVGTSDRMRIDNSGIDVSGNMIVDAGVSGTIDFGNVGSAYGRLYADSTGTFVGSYTNHPLILRTNNTERMQIDTGGNAIFTKAGGAYLQLKDASAVRGAINVETSDGLVFTTGASFTERMRISGDGSLSTPTAGTSNVRFGANAGNSIVSGGNYNTVVGDEAGTAITTGDGNVALGYQAGFKISTGLNNVAIGLEALKNEDGDGKNTAVGTQALFAQNAGVDALNTAVGFQTGAAVTTGVANTLVGSFAGDALTDSDYNVAVGYDALSSDTLGSRSVAMGYFALRAQNFTSAVDCYNTAVGFNSGGAVTTGTRNTLIGGLAGDSLTNANYNTAVGFNSLGSATTSSYNTAIGDGALFATTVGDRNVAVGQGAMQNNTEGDRNTAVGMESFHNLNITSNADSYNTGLGFQSGYAVTTGIKNTFLGGLTGDATTTGFENVAIGYDALGTNTVGSHSVAIGPSALRTQNFGSATNAYNTAVGSFAGYAVTTGQQNTLMGGFAGDALTDSDYNTAIGYKALTSDTLGSRSTALGHFALGNQNFTSAVDCYNTAIGFEAGGAVTTGTNNTLIGGLAGDAITTGTVNVAVGAGALGALTTASYNTGIGYAALSANITGAQNTAVGYSALTAATGADNTAVGSQALSSVTGGTFNTAVGRSAGQAVTTGVQNTLMGGFAGDALTDSDYNVAIGYQALTSDTLGSYSTAIGRNALYSQNFTSATASHNTALGYAAGEGITTGVQNTIIGSGAGDAFTDSNNNVAVGFSALSANCGDGNTALGHQALQVCLGVNNTAVGKNAQIAMTNGGQNTSLGSHALQTTTTGTYNIGIGYNSNSTSASASGQCTLGDGNVSNLRCNDQSISSLSDSRDKTDVIDSPYGLDFINTVRPVQFKWESRDGNVKDGSTRIGFIAQELLTASDGNNAVLDLVLDDNPDKLEAKYGNLLPIAIQAIQDLSAQVDALTARIEALEG